MIKVFWLAFVFSMACSLGQAQSYPQDYFQSPLPAPLVLSGTFGELRGNHFHSGIDLKTKGKVGMPILAIADGYVSRVKVSPYGFGRALYVVHPNGYTSVYAHLKSFAPEIEAYLKNQQQRKQKNEVNLFPDAGKFAFSKGDTIAFSGNSGGSGGPHLHFEIRDTRTEKIINPLLFGYEIEDTRHPSLGDLMVYEFEEQELVSSESYKLLDRGEGQYALAGNSTLEVNYLPAFGIEAFDRQNGAWNKNGVYRIELFLNDELCYDFKMETFAFAETRYINSHIDYGLKDCCRKTVNRLYLEPNNQLSVYQTTPKMNLPQLPIDSAKEVYIRVSDAAENQSEVRFTVKRTAPLNELPQVDASLPLFAYNQTNFFKKEQIELSMPAGALYRDVYFEYSRSKACADCLSEIHQVGFSTIPVQKYFTLKLKASAVPPKVDPSKLCVVSLREGNIVDYEGGTYKNGWVSTRTRQFGQFALAADSTPPDLRPLNFKSGSTVSSRIDLLTLKVSDNLSGVEKYNAYVNDSWTRLYFDAKNDELQLREEDLPDEPGTYTLKLVVEDDRENQTIQSYKIIRP